MATKAKRGPVKLKSNKVALAGWKFKKPGINGDIPALPPGKFADIEGQLAIPMGADEADDEADDEAAG